MASRTSPQNQISEPSSNSLQLHLECMCKDHVRPLPSVLTIAIFFSRLIYLVLLRFSLDIMAIVKTSYRLLAIMLSALMAASATKHKKGALGGGRLRVHYWRRILLYKQTSPFFPTASPAPSVCVFNLALAPYVGGCMVRSDCYILAW